jgi:Zn-dependent membrane protease YugP
MPWKLIILLGLLPIAAYWVSRYFFYQKAQRSLGETDCRLSTEDYAKKLSYEGKLSRGMQGKRTAAALAEVALTVAYEQLKTDHPQPVKMRKRADQWAQIVAPMSLLIAVFAIVVGRPVLICIAAVVVVNAMVAVMKFTTRAVAAHAASRAVESLRKARIPRQEDETAVELCIRSLTWK